MALRDLGFTLEQVRSFLDQALPTEQLRGMLKIRKAQIARNLASEVLQLRRVEAHLYALERNLTVPMQDILIKDSESVQIAETTGHIPGLPSFSYPLVPIHKSIAASMGPLT